MPIPFGNMTRDSPICIPYYTRFRPICQGKKRWGSFEKIPGVMRSITPAPIQSFMEGGAWVYSAAVSREESKT